MVCVGGFGGKLCGADSPRAAVFIHSPNTPALRLVARPLFDEVRENLIAGGYRILDRAEIRTALEAWPQSFSLTPLIADPTLSLELARLLSADQVIIIQLETATTVSGEVWHPESGHALQLSGRRILADTRVNGGTTRTLSFGVTADDMQAVVNETAQVITTPLSKTNMTGRLTAHMDAPPAAPPPRAETALPPATPADPADPAALPEILPPPVDDPPPAAPPATPKPPPAPPEPPAAPAAPADPAPLPEILPPPVDDPPPAADLSGPSELFPGAPRHSQAEHAVDPLAAEQALAAYMASPQEQATRPDPVPTAPRRPQPPRDSPQENITQLVQEWETRQIVAGTQRASLDRLDTRELNPVERLEIQTVITGVRNAMAVADKETRDRQLRAILDRAVPPQAVTPAWIPFWQARAIAAIKIHDVRAGWMAGQQLLALDALNTGDEAVLAVLVGLNLNNWLVPDPPHAPVMGSDYAVDLGGGAIMDFIWIPELEAWVGKYEVTNAQFRRFRPAHNSGTLDIANRHGYRPNLNSPNLPVVQVSYHDAVEFTEWLARQPGIRGTGVTPRLLDGDEWTAIARCGTRHTYPWGNDLPPTRGNYADAATGRDFPNWNILVDYDDGFATAAPVEESGRNEWGLYGVGGNVWEWTREHSGWGRTLRGSSWDYSKEEVLRVDFRGSFAEDSRNFALGFRVILVPND